MVTESSNPWFSIWLRPRATIRNIIDLDTTTTWQLLLMAAAGGVARSLTEAFQDDSGNDLVLAELLGGTVVGGALAGVVSFYRAAEIYRQVAGW
jgi:hypothetical protein